MSPTAADVSSAQSASAQTSSTQSSSAQSSSTPSSSASAPHSPSSTANRDAEPSSPPHGSECAGACCRHGSAFVVSRRAAIGAGVTTAAALLAACGGDDNPAPTTAATSPPGAAGGELANVADIPDGGSLVVVNGNTPIALAKDPSGAVTAHSAICTHQQCTVNAAGAELRCPCHGSVFDAVTGEVKNGPATAPLAEVAVTVSGNAVTRA